MGVMKWMSQFNQSLHKLSEAMTPWLERLPGFARNKPEKVVPGVIGVEIGQEGIAMVRVLQGDEGLVCTHYRYAKATTQDEFSAALRRFVSDYQLQGSRCVWLLHPNDYRLMLVDRPKVAEAELAQAVKWTLKDMISFPLDQAIVDAFLPDDAVLAHKDKCYVVVAQRTYLQSYLSLFTDAEVDLQAITVQELALNQLLMRSHQQPVALLQLWARSTVFLVVENGAIRMLRTLNMGTDQLQAGAIDLSRWQEELLRSINYYVASLKQAKPAVVYHLATSPSEGVEALLQLDPPVSALPLADLLQLPPDASPAALARCVTALGAAMSLAAAREAA